MALFDGFLQTVAGRKDIGARSLWKDDYERPDTRVITTHNYSRLPAVKKFIMVNQVLAEELKDLQEYDYCIHCSMTYQLQKNIGTHRCAYHPDPSSNPDVYRCCGISKYNPGTRWRGCRPCDHTPYNINEKKLHAPRWNKNSVFIRIPKAARSLFAFPNSSIIKEELNELDPLKSFLWVTRVANLTFADM